MLLLLCGEGGRVGQKDAVPDSGRSPKPLLACLLPQVLAGGCIGPANPPAAAAAASNSNAHEYSAAAAAGAANGSSGAPMTPTRMTRRTAAAMAAGTADGGSSGQFYPPTVIVGVTPKMDLYHEEVFGPVSLLFSYFFSCTQALIACIQLHSCPVLVHRTSSTNQLTPA